MFTRGAADVFETSRRAKVPSTGFETAVKMHRCNHPGCSRVTYVRPVCPVHAHSRYKILIDQQIEGNLGLYAFDPNDTTMKAVIFRPDDVVYRTQRLGEPINRSEVNARYGPGKDIIAPFCLTHSASGVYDGLPDRDLIMFANTSSKPNTVFREVGAKTVELVATAPIRNMDAITVDYGAEFTKTLISGGVPKVEYTPSFGPLTKSIYGPVIRTPAELKAAAAALGRKGETEFLKVARGDLPPSKLPPALRSELLFARWDQK